MNWTLFQPELYYFMVVMVFLTVSMLNSVSVKTNYYTALISAVIGVAVCTMSLRVNGTLFYNTYRVDLYSQLFKLMLAVGMFLVISVCNKLKSVDDSRHPEFYLLVATATLAMMMLTSAVHLLTIYICLELSSYSLYILVFLRKDQETGVNTALKYFLTGASASAVMLFGFALVYGKFPSIYLADLVESIPRFIDQPSVSIGMLLMLCGFFFKLGVFPFHFWLPDTYEGSANETTTFIATVSKVAAIAIMIRMVALIGGNSVYLIKVLIGISVITMTLGNLCAIAQQDLKRLLAYSSIAHAGYVLLGILCMSPNGYTGAVFYAVTILLLKFTCFMVVISISKKGESPSVDQLAGLHRRSPLLALALMLALFGLAGIPPTIGFSGKLLIFTAAMNNGYFLLVFIAMVNVVISLYYYLLVLKAAYLKEPVDDIQPLHVPFPQKVLTTALIITIVTIGIFPTYLIDLADAAVKYLM
ncbi:MAG: NADH-quinone oxidoreductase subunit N [Desulfobacteraceae bacterium]|nr:NADH-quinone oxidoreductase subunit N [Desulfobacteraceae bacterium]